MQRNQSVGSIENEERAALQNALSQAYDSVAEHTALYPAFYAWVAQHLTGMDVAPDATIIDIGCGTGRMLRELAAAGFKNLSGTDFSTACVELSKKAAPHATIWRHNVLEGPAGRFDVALLTEVIEHVTDPVLALQNVAASLADGGHLLLTFPNQDAFWPWYYLGRLLLPYLPKNGRLRHWFTWFTLPYEMRSTQPIDHAYSVKDVRRFLGHAGFQVIQEDGMRLWPMLRISGLRWTELLMDWVDRHLAPVLPKRLCYRYMLICRPTGK
ncbi:MAG: class I SAM-dependent methyltransferase [Chloroflexi bacterium]|nr:class I SAM-dependent methyltransferase [Chloroflexota bacterium]